MSNKNWVNNQQANQIVKEVQQSLLGGNPDSFVMQRMMDLISDVPNYSIRNRNRQGVIYRTLKNEGVRYRSHRVVNLSIDLDDVISTFWETVYNYLPQAQTTGELVAVRLVNGQESTTPIVGKDGQNVAIRPTNCNPIHYLRKMGIMGIRNLINSTYRRGLLQHCTDCGHNSAITKVEVKKACPQCDSLDSRISWPEASSSYRTKKIRVCNQCHYSWTRVFMYSCRECGSNNVRLESRYESADESTLQIQSTEELAEKVIIEAESTRDLDHLLEQVYKCLPNDPSNPRIVSKTKEIFNILTDARFLNSPMAQDICQKCNFNAPKVCSEDCGQSDCDHRSVPDPNVCCGSTTFSLDKCINFSKKIGEYHRCSVSLTARRVRKVRQYFTNFIRDHRESTDVCATLYTLLDEQGILSQY